MDYDTWLALPYEMPYVEHTRDSDCRVDWETGLCTECGACFLDQCQECKQRAFHASGCSLSDATSEE